MVKTKILYCKKHGYDLYISRKSLDKTRHLSWSKIPLILQYLDTYDWIYATDADTYIQLSNKSLDKIIDKKHKLYLNIELDSNTSKLLIFRACIADPCTDIDNQITKKLTMD